MQNPSGASPVCSVLKGILQIILYLKAALLSYFQEMPAIQ